MNGYKTRDYVLQVFDILSFLVESKVLKGYKINEVIQTKDFSLIIKYNFWFDEEFINANLDDFLLKFTVNGVKGIVCISTDIEYPSPVHFNTTVCRGLINSFCVPLFNAGTPKQKMISQVIAKALAEFTTYPIIGESGYNKLLNSFGGKNSVKPKVIVTGHKRHGKDTACEFLRDIFGYKFTKGSSLILLEEVIFPALKDKYGYNNKEDCFNDRDNHREEWYNELCRYNSEDPSKLSKKIFETQDIYCGLRNIAELAEDRKNSLVDYVFFIDASKRLPLESNTSMTIGENDCDIIIDNNGTVVEFYQNLIDVFRCVT